MKYPTASRRRYPETLGWLRRERSKAFTRPSRDKISNGGEGCVAGVEKKQTDPRRVNLSRLERKVRFGTIVAEPVASRNLRVGLTIWVRSAERTDVIFIALMENSASMKPRGCMAEGVPTGTVTNSLRRFGEREEKISIR